MPLTLTARRMHAAREIKLSLAEAQTELAAGVSLDRQAQLEGLITALQERLGKRRHVVLAARQASLQRGIANRRRRFRPVVWGFPAEYNPNLMGDRCDVCRSISWTAQPAGPAYFAWSCTVCSSLPTRIPNP